MFVAKFDLSSTRLGGYGTSPSYSYGAPGGRELGAAAQPAADGGQEGDEDLEDLYGDIQEAEDGGDRPTGRNPRPVSDKYDPEEAIEISVSGKELSRPSICRWYGSVALKVLAGERYH